MIKKLLTAALIFTGFGLSAQQMGIITDPVELVNPLMGTQSKPSLSNGSTCLLYTSRCV